MRRPAHIFVWVVLARLVLVTLLALLSAPLWPLFGLGVAVWGWPPHQPRSSDIARYLRYALTERPRRPGIAPLSRAWLILRVLGAAVAIPAHGVAWFLDEVLFARALRETPVVAPLIMLSAARSGSTQTGRYLERDPSLSAPSVLQSVCPYLWVWRLLPAGIERVFTPARVRRVFRHMTTEEFHQRHEGDPYLTDTLEILFLALRSSLFSPLLGPRVMAEEFSFGSENPAVRRMWEVDFVEYLDRLGRKTLIHAAASNPAAATGPACRLFVKGHFLDSRDALALQYPEAHFLTVVRDPVSRLRSVLNHLHGNAFDEALGAAPWSWLAATSQDAEVAYCEAEKDWFSRERGPKRTVIRFSDFVKDLEGTMSEVYRRCLGVNPLPMHVPREHTPRERTKYLVDRTLEEAGVDRDAFVARVADYREWCR